MLYVMDCVEGLLFIAFAWKLNAKIRAEKRDAKMLVLLKQLSNPISMFFLCFISFHAVVYYIRVMYYDIFAQDDLKASSKMIGESQYVHIFVVIYIGTFVLFA